MPGFINDDMRKQNRFIPDLRRFKRLLRWCEEEDGRFRLDRMSDRVLELFIRDLAPFYHGVPHLEKDSYPDVKTVRKLFIDFRNKKRPARPEGWEMWQWSHASYTDFDAYKDNELEELILLLEPLFHKNLNDIRIYKGTYPDYAEAMERMGQNEE